MTSAECQLEEQLIETLRALKYVYRQDKNDPGNGYTRTLLSFVEDSTTTVGWPT